MQFDENVTITNKDIDMYLKNNCKVGGNESTTVLKLVSITTQSYSRKHRVDTLVWKLNLDTEYSLHLNQYVSSHFMSF